MCDLINKVSFLSHGAKGNEEITLTEDLEESDLIVCLVIHRCCFAKGKQAIIGGELVIVLYKSTIQVTSKVCRIMIEYRALVIGLASKL